MKSYTDVCENYWKENNLKKVTNDEAIFFVKGYKHAEKTVGNTIDEQSNKFFLEGRRTGISETLGAIFNMMTPAELTELNDNLNKIRNAKD